MKSAIALLSLTAAVAGMPALARLPSAAGVDIVATAPGKAAFEDVVTATARVTAIDTADRVVTLQGPLGNTLNVKAGEGVKNFEQIEVGDDLVVTYAQVLTLGSRAASPPAWPRWPRRARFNCARCRPRSRQAWTSAESSAWTKTCATASTASR